jgi:hypothetical protein
MYELSTLAKNLHKILANFIANAAEILARFSANLNGNLIVILVRFLIESNSQRTKLHYPNRFRNKIMM